MLIVIAAATVASFATAVLVVMNQRLGDPLRVLESMDPQHIHRDETPRVGGIPLGIGVAFGALIGLFYFGVDYPTTWAVLISGTPVLLIGLAEDFNGKVSPGMRYAATVFAAGCGLIFAGTYVSRLDVFVLDWLLSFFPILIIFSLFAVAGVSQAFNIIDGKNGLALGAGVLALGSMGSVAWQIGDMPVAWLCTFCGAAALGVMMLTFPRGLIFLGDGGAYYLGFVVASVSALIVNRNEQVSAWFPLVAVAYPVYETVFTFVRRIFIERAGILHPDHLHFHSLLYRNLYLILRRRLRWPVWWVNAATAVTVLIPSAIFALAACQWATDKVILKLLGLLAGVGYLGFYIFLRRTGRFLRA